MPIYAPGRRDRHNRPLRSTKRNIVAVLSLTAMVDMFTVLVVFLLQNYQTTGEVIDLQDDVILPKASQVKELKPAHVVVVSPREITVDKRRVADLATVKASTEWEIPLLTAAIVDRFRAMEDSRKFLGLEHIRDAVDQTKPGGQREKPEDFRRVTVQADKSVDFLTIKKVMYTLYQAGASEINFAVIKNERWD